MTRTCSDCAGPISHTSKGRCKPCSLAFQRTDAEFQEKRAAALRAKCKDPAYIAEITRRLHAGHAKARLDPEKRARMYASIWKAREHLSLPGVWERWLASRPESARKRDETVMGWCPPEFRDEYFWLKNAKRLRAAEARAIILGHVAKQKKREQAKLTPFERQMAALQNGGTLYDFGRQSHG